jgi:hypothetical protein
MRETLLRMSRREQGASIQQFREGMDLMARWLGFVVLGLVSLGLLPVGALAAGCPNEQFRMGLSANLPDCRAYEMVSSVDKNDGAVEIGQTWRSSVSGDRMSYVAKQAFGDAQAGIGGAAPYVASRGADGWAAHALLPSVATSRFLIVTFAFTLAFSPDLSNYVMVLGGGGTFGQDDPPLVSGEPSDTVNLFVRATDSGASQLVDVTPAGVTPPALGANFQAATPDLSHVVFSEAARLTSNAPVAPGAVGLYDWSGGVVSLVSVLPGGEPDESGFPTNAAFISEDGSRIVFTEGAHVYLREDGVRTVQVDASQGPGPGGQSRFQAASSDGSKIFFTAPASRGLTNDTPTGGNPAANINLYEYDVAGGRLADLTTNSEADVVEGGNAVIGASRDGSYLYFVATGVLAGGATAGEPNLYVWHADVTSLVATLEGEGGEASDSSDWTTVLTGVKHITSRVTPDGTHVAFESVLSLTGYDNTDANTGQRDHEVFLYDASTGGLVCASCDPSGARPVGSSLIGLGESGSESGATQPQRWLSDDGSRLFFESYDAVVPPDVNGQGDVYVYEGGAPRLVSSGTSGEESRFLEASPSGDDVFFVTMQQLVGQDTDRQYDLYDARVDGGFPAPVSPVVCAGEGCRGAPSGASVLGVPGSVTFSGAGNLVVSAALPAAGAPKAKKPKPRVKRRKQRHKRVKGKRRARRARGSRSTGKRG